MVIILGYSMCKYPSILGDFNSEFSARVPRIFKAYVNLADWQ